PVSKRGRRCKRGRVKPFRGSMRSRAKHRLAGDVGPDRILPQYGPGVRSVSKNGDGERHSRLHLVDRRQMPVLRDKTKPFLLPQCRNIVNTTQREAMPYITARALLQA